MPCAAFIARIPRARPEHSYVFGGARSGKSRYAESLAKGQKFYVATAEALDDEMVQRIEAHRQRRGQGWETFEVPLDLVGALQTLDGKGRFILVDCLTIWLSNLILVKLDARIEIEMLCECLKNRVAGGVGSNEVGLGIVPATSWPEIQGRPGFSIRLLNCR